MWPAGQVEHEQNTDWPHPLSVIAHCSQPLLWLGSSVFESFSPPLHCTCPSCPATSSSDHTAPLSTPHPACQ